VLISVPDREGSVALIRKYSRIAEDGNTDSYVTKGKDTIMASENQTNTIYDYLTAPE
jgi:hypothetical protein